MAGGVLRLGDANAGGGLITLAGCDPTVLVNGRPIALAGATVTPHPPCGADGGYPHCIAEVVWKPSSILVNGKPIAAWPTYDTCGHPRMTGSLNVLVGGSTSTGG